MSPVDGSPSPYRRHVLVLLGLAVVAVVGGVLVATGRGTKKAATTTVVTPTTLPSPPLRFLGGYPTTAALQTAVRQLDPETLLPKPGTSPAPTTTVAPLRTVTKESLERCKTGLTETSDQALGALVSSASATVAGTPLLVATFRLTKPRAGTTGIRGVVADVQTCQIKFAIDY